MGLGSYYQAPTGVRLPSLLHGPPSSQQLGPHGWTDVMVNKQGLKLAMYFWPAEGEARGLIQLVHGHGAHLQNEFLKNQGPGRATVYEGSWVQAWNRAGFSICGIDQQGLGFSEGVYGLRCIVLDFNDYIDDVVQLRRYVRGANLPKYGAALPCFIVGCSLGGCIAVNAIHRQPSLYKAAVLCSAMLSLERLSKKGWNKYLRPIATLISFLFPTWALIQTNRNTLYPDLQAEYDLDPLCWHGKTRVRNAAEYLRATEDTCREMATMSFPFLAVYGGKDTLCDPAGSKLLYSRTRTQDKRLEEMPEMWHVLLKEPGNEGLRAMILSWMQERL